MKINLSLAVTRKTIKADIALSFDEMGGLVYGLIQ